MSSAFHATDPKQMPNRMSRSPTRDYNRDYTGTAEWLRPGDVPQWHHPNRDFRPYRDPHEMTAERWAIMFGGFGGYGVVLWWAFAYHRMLVVLPILPIYWSTREVGSPWSLVIIQGGWAAIVYLLYQYTLTGSGSALAFWAYVCFIQERNWAHYTHDEVVMAELRLRGYDWADID